MGYENKAFPHTSGTSYNHYGQRGIEDGVVSGGQVHGNGVVEEKVVYITGEDFGDGTSYTTQLTLPAGAVFKEAVAEVNEAFVLGGTTPTINVGTEGTAQTDYVIELSEADAEAEGVYTDTTGAGDYTSPLTANASIAVSLGGTSPTVTDAGAAKVVIRYVKI